MLKVRIAWKEGRLVFKETPLPEVLRCLANFYNVDFNVMDPVLDSYRLLVLLIIGNYRRF